MKLKKRSGYVALAMRWVRRSVSMVVFQMKRLPLKVMKVGICGDIPLLEFLVQVHWSCIEEVYKSSVHSRSSQPVVCNNRSLQPDRERGMAVFLFLLYRLHLCCKGLCNGSWLLCCITS